ncbi:unnamed protein product, partial [Sphacelaria rigidula]
VLHASLWASPGRGSKKNYTYSIIPLHTGEESQYLDTSIISQVVSRSPSICSPTICATYVRTEQRRWDICIQTSPDRRYNNIHTPRPCSTAKLSTVGRICANTNINTSLHVQQQRITSAAAPPSPSSPSSTTPSPKENVEKSGRRLCWQNYTFTTCRERKYWRQCRAATLTCYGITSTCSSRCETKRATIHC